MELPQKIVLQFSELQYTLFCDGNGPDFHTIDISVHIYVPYTMQICSNWWLIVGHSHKLAGKTIRNLLGLKVYSV